jgi:hypothetical protein
MIALLLLITQSDLVPERNRVIDFCEPAARLVNLTGPLSAALGIDEPWKSKIDEAIEFYRSNPNAPAPYPTQDEFGN